MILHLSWTDTRNLLHFEIFTASGLTFAVNSSGICGRGGVWPKTQATRERRTRQRMLDFELWEQSEEDSSQEDVSLQHEQQRQRVKVARWAAFFVRCRRRPSMAMYQGSLWLRSRGSQLRVLTRLHALSVTERTCHRLTPHQWTTILHCPLVCRILQFRKPRIFVGMQV